MPRSSRYILAVAGVLGIACQNNTTNVPGSLAPPQNLGYQLDASGDPNTPAGILLVWDDVLSADLASYRVYSRASLSGSFLLRGETSSDTFHDNGVPPLQYAVTAVDAHDGVPRVTRGAAHQRGAALFRELGDQRGGVREPLVAAPLVRHAAPRRAQRARLCIRAAADAGGIPVLERRQRQRRRRCGRAGTGAERQPHGHRLLDSPGERFHAVDRAGVRRRQHAALQHAAHRRLDVDRLRARGRLYPQHVPGGARVRLRLPAQRGRRVSLRRAARHRGQPAVCHFRLECTNRSGESGAGAETSVDGEAGGSIQVSWQTPSCQRSPVVSGQDDFWPLDVSVNRLRLGVLELY